MPAALEKHVLYELYI